MPRGVHREILFKELNRPESHQTVGIGVWSLVQARTMMEVHCRLGVFSSTAHKRLPGDMWESASFSLKWGSAPAAANVSGCGGTPWRFRTS